MSRNGRFPRTFVTGESDVCHTPPAVIASPASRTLALMSGGRTLSVLVADLVESTRLNIELGPDRADEVRRIIFSRFDDAIAAHNGTLIKTMGDGCLVTYPSASESVGSGIDMIGAINRLAHQVPGLKLRVAVAVGDVTQEGDDVFGEPVIVATRLCAAAPPGQVLTTDLVRELSGGRGGFEWERVGGLFLKGIDQPVACSAARPPADADTRLRLPRPLRARTAEFFVGRVGAMDTLVRSWKDAMTGERRAVVVSGEPGVGKSRLVATVTRQADEDGALTVFGRCEEDLAVPYQPFADALRPAVQSAPRDMLAAHMSVHGGALGRLFPRLKGPEQPEAAPEAEQLRIIAALTDLLERLSREQPVVLVIDDIHWAAPATVQALRHLISDEDPAAFLLLATYRDTEVDRHHPLRGAPGRPVEGRWSAAHRARWSRPRRDRGTGRTGVWRTTQRRSAPAGRRAVRPHRGQPVLRQPDAAPHGRGRRAPLPRRTVGDGGRAQRPARRRRRRRHSSPGAARSRDQRHVGGGGSRGGIVLARADRPRRAGRQSGRRARRSGDGSAAERGRTRRLRIRSRHRARRAAREHDRRRQGPHPPRHRQRVAFSARQRPERAVARPRVPRMRRRHSR